VMWSWLSLTTHPIILLFYTKVYLETNPTYSGEI
jgi:hypothetical protein